MKPNLLTDQLIDRTLEDYGFTATPEFCDSLRVYVDLLLRWNQKIALTTIVDPIEILRRHFGESLFGITAIPIRLGRLADVGTGAGFPAIPIRMAIPDLACTLIESNQKKATFVAEVVRALELKNVEINRGRMEDFPAASPPFDFVVSRALGIHDQFLDWSATRLTSKGKVAFWIGDQDAAKISLNSKFSWQPLAKIPDSDHRAVLIGAPRSR
jgi:16S rRNA (guanine527-N7)-methyltransferase